MNETATTIDAAAPALPRLRHVAAELDRRLFVAGVAACTAGVAVFLLVQLSAWPPHEDETLPLFVGRQPIDGLFDIVLGKRGGAPLHFLLAWIVAHAGGGLETMRFFSALFAVASIPAIAVLGNRLAGRGPALAACVLAAASWILLFHGIYARMYSLFLFLSTLSYLALLRATERGGKRAWTLWAIVMLLTIGSHPYGALVLGSQGLYVLVTRSRLRQAVVAFGVVLLLAVPLWRSSVVLANRLEVGVARRRRQAAHASGGVRVPLARGRRRLDRLRRRPRDRAGVRGVRPRLAGAETAAQRAPDGLRRDHADGLLPCSAGSAGTRRPSRAT